MEDYETFSEKNSVGSGSHYCDKHVVPIQTQNIDVFPQ
jgi:hypothetical protein